LIKIAAKLYYF